MKSFFSFTYFYKIFNYNVDFPIFYKDVYNCDFIILTLDPEYNKEYKNRKVTGSAQLSYGFVKPVLINENFKNIYNITSENSFIYNEKNFYNIMKNAINQSNKDYKIMQHNLLMLTYKIHQNSILNMKKTFNSILIKN